MSKNIVISGAAGKQISFVPALKTQAAQLKSAAREGYYYPMLALKQLASLSSGFNGKHNVFIPNINDSRTHTLQMVHVYLPGIRATVEQRPNSAYVVTQLDLSDGYTKIGKGMDKPGIYKAEKVGDEYNTKYKSNDRITPEDGRLVVICGGGYKEPKEAAEDAHNCIQEVAGAYAMRSEFDIVYTGLGQELGKRGYDPSSIHASKAVASITANAMIHAQKKKGVLWASMFGGSAVLTQAMHIVAQQKINLDNHIVKMYHPQTNPSPAMRLAQQIGITMDKEFVKAGGRRALRTYCNAMLGNRVRAKNKEDPYSWKDYDKDLAKGAMSGVGLMGAGLFALTFAPPAGALAVGGALASGAGACHLLWTHAKNLRSKPKG